MSGTLTVPSDQPAVVEDEPTYASINDYIIALKRYQDRKITETIDMQSHVLFDKK